jgi:hypothetical protein
VAAHFFLDFFTTQNVFVVFLLTLNNKLHLVSIENAVVKKKKEQQKTSVGKYRPIEKTKVSIFELRSVIE